MATIIRSAIVRAGGQHKHFLGVTTYTSTQNRGIAGKHVRSTRPSEPKPKPFPYESKFYTYFHTFFDKTTSRFDENTKVVVVEGPIGVGKTEFAEGLADELGMKHFPEANLDHYYITPTGVDLRTLDKLIPEDCRTFDHTNFCENPKHRLAANYQLMTYSARYSQYIDALAHLLNTGQGVVLERSPFSDFVFMEAMHSEKFVSSAAREVYYEVRQMTLSELVKPHLVIYLDIPIETVKSRIQKRNLSYEVKSPAFTDEYLAKIEHQYKHKYLREISNHSELLIYDWTGKGETEVVVEDIERIDFDNYDPHSPKMKDWRVPREVEWADMRQLYTNQKPVLMNYFNVPRFDVSELVTSADDAFKTTCVYETIPGLEYTVGYNKVLGDTGLWTKQKVPKYTVVL